MKKVLTLLLTAAMLLSAGCTTGEQPADGPDQQQQQAGGESQKQETALETEPEGDSQNDGGQHASPECEEKTLKTLEQFRNGDFSTLYTNVTEQVTKQVPQQQLETSWKSLEGIIGTYEEFVRQESTEQNGQTVVVTVEKYSLQKVKSTFVYDKDGKVSAFGFTFDEEREAYVPESTDAFEEIEIKVGAEEQKMDGILTLPKGVEKPPVAVLIQGSGQSDLNETIGGTSNKPFYDLAHGLAERGVATIRYNKRYYQYPETVTGELTIQDEVIDDAEAAIQMAVADERVNGEQVYLIGHSLGGMLAPKIAEDNPEIKGIVSLAGSLRKLHEIMYDQTVDALALQTTMSQEEKDSQLAQVKAEIDQIDSLTKENAPPAVMGQPSSYWISLNEIDGPAISQRLTIPILVLQGENDFQVKAETDFALWKETLQGKDNVTFTLYPGLSHMFLPAPNAEPDMAVYSKPAVVDPRVIQDIAQWIKGTAE